MNLNKMLKWPVIPVISFLRLFAITGSLLTVLPGAGYAQSFQRGTDDRVFAVKVLTTVAFPVLDALSKDQLKATMPVEAAPGTLEGRRKVTYLEAFGRTMAGMAPWLELGPDDTPEGRERARFIALARTCLQVSVDPNAKDRMNFTENTQPLVDAAFLAHALMRAPQQLWVPLDTLTKSRLIAAFRSCTAAIRPYESNWTLFAAMIETFLLKTTGTCNRAAIDHALQRHAEWYKGDGFYGDGKDFHWDYYNSYVIQPMLLDIVAFMQARGETTPDAYKTILARAQRYALIQERLIMPDGSFPAIGRSLAYRFGAFQHLSQLSLEHLLPAALHPGQVRNGLLTVVQKMINAPGTFDAHGWLQIGFYGHQSAIGETYISTGSLYLCTVGLLSLGLPPGDPFWTAPAEDWTAKKIWQGENIPTDHAISE